MSKKKVDQIRKTVSSSNPKGVSVAAAIRNFKGLDSETRSNIYAGLDKGQILAAQKLEAAASLL